MKTIEQGIKDQENKTEDIRNLEKINDNHFRLTVENKGNRIITIKEFDKKQMKDIYKEVEQNISNLQTMRIQNKQKARVLTGLPEEEQNKVEDFIFMLSQAKSYQEAETAKAMIPNLDKQIDFLKMNQKEIRVVLPEVLR